MPAMVVTEGTFASEVSEANVPVLVDFYTPFCGPCKTMSPVIDRLSEEFEGRVKVVKLNGLEDSDLANQYGIKKVPTLVVFNGGNEVERRVGALTEEPLRQWLESISNG